MHREPLIFPFFRLILIAAFCGLMAMLYWSSTLIEQNVKDLQKDFIQMKQELLNTKSEINHMYMDILKSLQTEPSSSPSISQPLPSLSSPDNLLTVDSFYTQTLPHLLGKNFKPHGIRKEATIGKPAHLHPLSSWSEVATWNSLCTVSLTAQAVGQYETFTPQMALSMVLKNDPEGRPEYWLSLRQDVYWEPLNSQHFNEKIHLNPFFLRRHQVTAHDFKFYFDAIMNPHVEEGQAVALRLYYNEIEEMRVVDDFTLVVRWKTHLVKEENGKEFYQMKYLAQSLTGSLRPLARFVYQYFADGTKIISEDADPLVYRTNPIWAQNFSQHWAKHVIVSCGPWLFDGMTEREIRFRRNSSYYDPYAALTEAYEIKFRNSNDAIWEQFKTGTLDLFPVPPHLLAEWNQFLQSQPYEKQARQGLGIKRLDYLARSYTYIGWNEARLLFQSRKVRQALTLAIDRDRIIRQNLNGMGVQTTGTFFPYSPSYDSSLKPYPFDPDQARQLLQEEGWYDHDGDGIIDRIIHGKLVPFRFILTYYIKNSTTKSICDYIATALKEIGIDCRPNGVDIADLSAIFEDKDFDAMFLSWVLGTPPEDPKQLWYSTGAKEKGSSNAIGFAHPEVDRIIEKLENEFDPKKRIQLYHRFNAILYEEAPYTFLYAPKIALTYRDYLQNVFIPAERQDLIPGANVGEPDSNLFWIRPTHEILQ